MYVKSLALSLAHGNNGWCVIIAFPFQPTCVIASPSQHLNPGRKWVSQAQGTCCSHFHFKAPILETCTQVRNVDAKCPTCWNESSTVTRVNQLSWSKYWSPFFNSIDTKASRNRLWTSLRLKDQLSEENNQVTRWSTFLFRKLQWQGVSVRKWGRALSERTSRC